MINVNILLNENYMQRKVIIMAQKRRVATPKVVVDKNAAQFMRTAQNLAKKGKTNKKLRGRNANPKALKYNIAVA